MPGHGRPLFMTLAICLLIGASAFAADTGSVSGTVFDQAGKPIADVLVKISGDLVFHQNALADLRKRMAAEKTKSPRLDVARFKELTGVSRKYAIPLLEYLDREHVTRRMGDERVIL